MSPSALLVTLLLLSEAQAQECPAGQPAFFKRSGDTFKPVGTGGARIEQLAASGGETWGIGPGGLFRLVHGAWVVAVERGGFSSLWANKDHVFVVGGRHPMVGSFEDGRWSFSELTTLKGDHKVTGLGEEAWFYGGSVHRWARGALREISTDGYHLEQLVVRGPRDVWGVGQDSQSTPVLLRWDGKRWSATSRPANFTPQRLSGGPTPWLFELSDTQELMVSVFDGRQWVDSKLGEFGNLVDTSIWAPRFGETVMVGRDGSNQRQLLVWNGRYWSSAPNAVQATFVGGAREPLYLRSCGDPGTPPPATEASPAENQPQPVGPGDIMEVVFAHKAALVACAETQRRREPGVSGKLVVKWTVLPSGVVTKTEVVTREFEKTFFAQCVVAQVKQFRFPRHRVQGEPITFPFKF